MEDFYWLNKDSVRFLERGYLLEGETPESRMWDIAKTAERELGIDGWAKKFYGYLGQGFYSLSSPIWSNYGRERGLPISCYGSYVQDTITSITGEKFAEIAAMTKAGGGTSAFFGALRGRGAPINSGGTSTGSVHFMELYETLLRVVSQGSVRRGSFAAYLPIDHPDIEEFLKIKSEGNSIQDMSIGVTVTDKWMKSMIEGDSVKRKIWGNVIKKRFESGYPYIFWSDNVNKGKSTPKVYRDSKMKIHHSNLCTEIMLPNGPDESFVCDLSSINVSRWDDIKETDAVETMVQFLDVVMTEFIRKAKTIPYMEHAVNFAKRHRALGIGVLGWHSLLQQKRIAFESFDAKMLNAEIWSTIKKRAEEASAELAQKFGFPEMMVGYGRRNTTLLAVAPTTSSAMILGQISPSIEPLNSNYFTKDLAKGKFTWRNPELKAVLKEFHLDTPEVWRDILQHGGSVQHIKELPQEMRDVFKTFGEISQKEVVIQAAQRQAYIDQGQSLNLMIGPKVKPKEVNELMIFAWENGIKTLYYQRSANPAQELARNILNCTSCEA